MSNVTILAACEPNSTPLPYFAAQVPAGFPSPARDHMEHKLSLDTLLDIQAPHTYIVAVSGDSMIFNGDHLIVSRALNPRAGNIVVACLNGDVFVKRLALENGQYILRSENPDYAPRYILENDELMFWGVVTHSLRNHLSHAFALIDCNCSGQLIPDTELRFFSAMAGGSPPLNFRSALLGWAQQCVEHRGHLKH